MSKHAVRLKEFLPTSSTEATLGLLALVPRVLSLEDVEALLGFVSRLRSRGSLRVIIHGLKRVYVERLWRCCRNLLPPAGPLGLSWGLRLCRCCVDPIRDLPIGCLLGARSFLRSWPLGLFIDITVEQGWNFDLACVDLKIHGTLLSVSPLPRARLLLIKASFTFGC